MSDDGVLKGTRVAKRANIRDIRLFESSAELKDLSGPGRLQWDLDVTPDVSYSDGDDHFVITIFYRIEIERADDSGKFEKDGRAAEVAIISFRFGALYDLRPDSRSHKIKREELDAYAKTCAISALYPYMREYVHDVTIRMGLPPLIMDVHPSPSAVESDASK